MNSDANKILAVELAELFTVKDSVIFLLYVLREGTGSIIVNGIVSTYK